MPRTVDLLRQGQGDLIWKRYGGFIDLSLKEFMQIQERLLMEQIQLLGGSELGRQLLGGRLPASVEEFQATVPLTTYEPYAPYLLDQREDVLPVKPSYWIHTSGRSGEYRFKWVPVTETMFQKWAEVGMAAAIFATCRRRGDIALEVGDKFLYCLAPMPYTSGLMAHAVLHEFPFEFMPPVEASERMAFQERIEEGFRLSFSKGLDVFFGISSVLVRMGEAFAQRSGSIRLSRSFLHPRTLSRIARGLVHKQLAGRALLPRDLWNPKGIMSSGMDTAIYREKIKDYWGRYPLEMYGGSEFGLIALQTWDYGAMTFVPDLNFLEFIPAAEHLRSRAEPGYHPRAVLLDRVTPGERYEVVITNFGGGAFVRYRIGDMVQITARRNEQLKIDIPQMVFDTRCDDVIDLADFTRLTERVIWRALEESGVRYADWVARKEYVSQTPVLHLYVEPKDGEARDEVAMRRAVDACLKGLDSDYRDMAGLLGLEPLCMSLLPRGTFQRYTAEREAAGADPAHLKPPHMKPPDDVLARLLAGAGVAHGVARSTGGG